MKMVVSSSVLLANNMTSKSIIRNMINHQTTSGNTYPVVNNQNPACTREQRRYYVE